MSGKRDHDIGVDSGIYSRLVKVRSKKSHMVIIRSILDAIPDDIQETRWRNYRTLRVE